MQTAVEFRSGSAGAESLSVGSERSRHWHFESWPSIEYMGSLMSLFSFAALLVLLNSAGPLGSIAMFIGSLPPILSIGYLIPPNACELFHQETSRGDQLCPGNSMEVVTLLGVKKAGYFPQESIITTMCLAQSPLYNDRSLTRLNTDGYLFLAGQSLH